MSAGRFARAIDALRAGIAARVTPGAQLSVRWCEAGTWRAWDHAEGALSYDPGAALVTTATHYDLASLTKALVGMAAARLWARGELERDAPLARYLPESAGHDAGTATLEALASHRAQLPAWRPYYQAISPVVAESGTARADLIAAVARTTCEPSHGAARYSDVGYILFGEALARAARCSLGELVHREIMAPLGLLGELGYRGVGARAHDPAVPPTERCAWRGCVVQGSVHDENAYALGGVSGHAGLFGTARAVAEVGAATLRALKGERAWVAPDLVREMVAPRPGGSHRLVWDGKSPEGSSVGNVASAATFGHLGFTGTSLWCDPEIGAAVALLTNRVHPSRDNAAAIKALRIAVHDAVFASLVASG